MVGIIPFLMQWLALSQFSSRMYQNFQPFGQPPKSHWSLLSEFKDIPEDELEKFLPQICNMVLDRESLVDQELFDYFEQILIHKCTKCLTFGTKVCGLLKSSEGGSPSGLFRGMLSSSPQQQMREQRIRSLLEKIEYATCHGHNLPNSMAFLRANYFQDFQFFTDNLARLGYELKSYPDASRSAYLKSALSQYNTMLFHRMLSQGKSTSMQTSVEDIYSYPLMSAQEIAQLCPAAACFSLHLPLQRCNEKVKRILRFVESECEVLPSRERCPYLVVVELLEQDFNCQSVELYSQGSSIGLSAADVIHGRLGGFNAPGEVLSIASQARRRLEGKPYQPLPKPGFGFRDRQGSDIEQTDDNSSFGTDERLISASVDEREKEYEQDETSSTNPGHKDMDNLENVALFARNEGHSENIEQNPDYQTQYNSEVPAHSPSLLESYGFPDNPTGESNRGVPGFRGGASPYPGDAGMNSQKPTYDVNGFPAYPSGPYGGHQGYPAGGMSNGMGNEGFGAGGYGDLQEYGDNPMGNSWMNSYGPPQQGEQQPQFSAQYQQQYSQGDMMTYVRPQTWEEKKSKVRTLSPFGHLDGWDLKSFIVKSGDDLQKEILASQLLEYCQNVFKQEELDIYLRPYQILSTGYQAGLIEFVEGAQSIDRIKKNLKSGSLKDYFNMNFGASFSMVHTKAVQNFMKSLVGYSLFTYLAQLKDRHNANLLIDSEGHIVHIDFGFIFGDSPGFNINFESAPFKLTKEYVDILGGIDSPVFRQFEELFLRGFEALQKHSDGIASIIQLFYGSKRKSAAEGVRTRLLFPQNHADIFGLIGESIDNWRTRQYDWFQQRTNNIAM